MSYVLGSYREKGFIEFGEVRILKGEKTWKLEFCEHYVFEKQTRLKFDIATDYTKGDLDYIHAKVYSPTKVSSFGGMHYFVTFMNDFSRSIGVCHEN